MSEPHESQHFFEDLFSKPSEPYETVFAAAVPLRLEMQRTTGRPASALVTREKAGPPRPPRCVALRGCVAPKWSKADPV